MRRDNLHKVSIYTLLSIDETGFSLVSEKMDSVKHPFESSYCGVPVCMIEVGDAASYA